MSNSWRFPTTTSQSPKGQGCHKCVGRDKTSEEFINQAREIHGNKYGYSNVDYKGSHIKVNITCPKHGDFPQTPNSHLNGQGCDKCNESKGEKLVDNILSKYEIEKIRPKRFSDCTNKPKEGVRCFILPFDFYLPKLNTCIEYDGEQHYRPVSRFGGEEAFKRQQIRDKLKNEYCKKNNIKLIRIPYTMSPEEVEMYLLKELGITK